MRGVWRRSLRQSTSLNNRHVQEGESSDLWEGTVQNKHDTLPRYARLRAGKSTTPAARTCGLEDPPQREGPQAYAHTRTESIAEPGHRSCHVGALTTARCKRRNGDEDVIVLPGGRIFHGTGMAGHDNGAGRLVGSPHFSSPPNLDV